MAHSFILPGYHFPLLSLKSNSLVKNFPEVHEFRSVKMPLVSRELDDVDGPVGDVFLEDAVVPFDVEGGDWRNKNMRMFQRDSSIQIEIKIP